MSGMIERQVIVTWYTLDEKRPPEDQDVVIHAWCDIEPYGWKGVVQGDG